MGSTLTNLLFHIVFSTKNRAPMIEIKIRDELYRYIGGIIKGENGTLIEIGGMPDHIHLFLKLKPTHSISNIMQKVKGGSSKWINKEKRLQAKFSWQDGYGAFSVSESQAEAVIEYIKEQKDRHKTLSFKDELIRLLERHRIEYDNQYLWT